MLYVVTYSTDLRCKQTKIRKFTSKKRALEFAKSNSGDFTYDNPELEKNYHHTFSKVYDYPGRIDMKWIKKEMGYATSTYPCTENDAIHSYLYKYGLEIN